MRGFAVFELDACITKMDRETEFLIQRAAPLVFGVYAFRADTRQVRGAGSGIFIAPFLCLGAGHVTKDLLKLDYRGTLPIKPGHFRTQHNAALFQFADPFQSNQIPGTWRIHVSWDSHISDFTFMRVSPGEGVPLEMQKQMPTGFFEWLLEPPPIGSEVLLLGYPNTEIHSDGDLIQIKAKFTPEFSRVTKPYKIKRDRGLYNFPGFIIDKEVDPAFSGGPVFYENKLCGLVSGGSIEGTYISSLWPFCLMEYEFPDYGTLGSKMPISSLFDSGEIKSSDWKKLKNRISIRVDEDEKPYAHIEDE